jgi:hypothetical protein
LRCFILSAIKKMVSYSAFPNASKYLPSWLIGDTANRVHHHSSPSTEDFISNQQLLHIDRSLQHLFDNTASTQVKINTESSKQNDSSGGMKPWWQDSIV